MAGLQSLNDTVQQVLILSSQVLCPGAVNIPIQSFHDRLVVLLGTIRELKRWVISRGERKFNLQLRIRRLVWLLSHV